MTESQGYLESRQSNDTERLAALLVEVANEHWGEPTASHYPMGRPVFSQLGILARGLTSRGVRVRQGEGRPTTPEEFDAVPEAEYDHAMREGARVLGSQGGCGGPLRLPQSV